MFRANLRLQFLQSDDTHSSSHLNTDSLTYILIENLLKYFVCQLVHVICDITVVVVFSAAGGGETGDNRARQQNSVGENVIHNENPWSCG